VVKKEVLGTGIASELQHHVITVTITHVLSSSLKNGRKFLPIISTPYSFNTVIYIKILY
jgi:hypothetical protein